MLPFTSDVFFSLFETYNRAIWPAQVVAYVLALAALALALRPVGERGRTGGRIVAAVLAGMWLWTGVAYHMQHFATINFLAPVFGWFFVAQAALFAWTGVVRGEMPAAFRPDAFGWAGLALVAVALAVYPLIGWLLGHGWPASPLVGVTPCPTTILTMGLLLLVPGRTPWHLLPIPVLWSLVGGSAAWLLDVWQDLLLPLAGLGGLALMVWKNRRAAAAA